MRKWRWMKLNAKLHFLASLPAVKDTPPPTVQGAGRVPERVCMPWRRDRSPCSDLPSTFRSLEESFPTGFPTTILQVLTIFNMRATSIAYLILHYFKTVTVFLLTQQITKFHRTQFSPRYYCFSRRSEHFISLLRSQTPSN